MTIYQYHVLCYEQLESAVLLFRSLERDLTPA